MQLKQYYLGCLSHASYLIVDEKSRVAAVVDPQRDVDQYIADARSLGCEIKHVFLTHFHADFLAGHIELREQTGATIYLGRRGESEFSAVKLADGDTVEFGDVKLSTLETPGHTPEGISLLVYDLAKDSDKPFAVLTGDTLFIGDVGRPDLLASIGVTAEELASMLYDSLTQKLMRLPDETLVYPAHGAGSMCGKNLSKETVSTIGEQKKFNYALQPMSREEFMKIVTAEQPDAPGYFVHDAILNRKERPSLHDTIMDSMEVLSLKQVLAMQHEGAQILDVRSAVDFEGAHLKGSLNIGLQGSFATWCGTLLDPSLPIVLVTEEGDEEESVMRLGRIGFDNVVGYLVHGMDSLRHTPELIGSIDRITAVALSEQLGLPGEPLVVDVRTEKEWASGHIQGSMNVPLNHLRERIVQIPLDRPVVIHCQSGYRSAAACSILKDCGIKTLQDLVGGFKAWSASKLPVVVEEGQSSDQTCSNAAK